MVIKTEVCAFSDIRIYPGHGVRMIRRDGQVSRRSQGLETTPHKSLTILAAAVLGFQSSGRARWGRLARQRWSPSDLAAAVHEESLWAS